MKAIVDRIEGDYALIELGDEIIDYPLNKLPSSIKEGDIIEIKDGHVEILEEETDKRRNEIEDLFASLVNKEADDGE